jgi:hypothetical protein
MSDTHDPTNRSEPDDLRFAPPPAEQPDRAAEAAASSDAAPDTAADEFALSSAEVDLDAALAAISALDDVLAEKEAAERAEIERERAVERAQAEREARLKNPELFFPMPPLTTMQRGRLDSVLPALVLIGAGAWLTFTLTSGGPAPSLALITLLAGGIPGVILLARWLASGRWAIGALFWGLSLALVSGISAALLTQDALVSGWPLLAAGPGLAFMVTAVAAGEGRLLLPGALLTLSSLAALLVTDRRLPDELLALLATAWPAAIIAIAVLLLLPLLARR